MTTAGIASSYKLPTAHGQPTGITAGADGALWFTEYTGDKIGRITTAGKVNEFPIPTADSEPEGITAGPDGALWFTESKAGKIGRVTTAGTFTEYPVITAGATPYWIAAGPDGALWFTEIAGNRIGRITTVGAMIEYPIPTPLSYPEGITAGPDGAMWFTETGNKPKIGRITVTGQFTEYTTSGGGFGITTGPDGALWFTESYANIGRITTAGVVTEYPIPTATNGAVGPNGITLGADDELWFAKADAPNIGQVVFSNAALTVSPSAGFYPTTLSFAGSGFGVGETVSIYTGGIGSRVLATAATDSSGSFTATARDPQWPYGPRLFLGAGQTSGNLGAASFSVGPRLILTPNSGAVGSTITAQGYGFGSGEFVNVYWDVPGTYLGYALANLDGTFSGSAAFTFAVPSESPTGAHKVLGMGQLTKARGTGSFTVQ